VSTSSCERLRLHVQKGKEELLAGEVRRAIDEFRVAISKQRDNPSAT
jgi:hypothetical protein